MAEIKSHNNTSGSVTKKLLVPDLLQSLIYVMISIMLLCIFNIPSIWGWVNKSNAGGKTDQAIASPSYLTNIWDSFSGGRLPQIIFWVIVGIVVYGLIWFVWNVSNNLRNDVIAGDYVHPKGYDTRKYWQSLVARKVFFVAAVVIFIIYIFVFVKLFSLMAGLCETAVTDFDIKHSVSILITCTLVGALLTHILAILGRIALNSWQTIYIDL